MSNFKEEQRSDKAPKNRRKQDKGLYNRPAVTEATHGQAHSWVCASALAHGRSCVEAWQAASPGLRGLAIFRLFNAVSSSYLMRRLLLGFL